MGKLQEDYICLTGVDDKKYIWRKNGRNFLYLMKTINPHIQEAQWTQSTKRPKEKPTEQNIIYLIKHDKQKTLKHPEKKRHNEETKDKNDSRLLIRDNTNQKTIDWLLGGAEHPKNLFFQNKGKKDIFRDTEAARTHLQ